MLKRICLSVLVFIAFAMIIGCPFPATGIIPSAGDYSFSQKGEFWVYEDSKNGEICLGFSSDGSRWDSIPINDGAFRYQWGQIGGTHCPTDAYIITGHFTTDTHAEGRIRYGYDCAYGWALNFEADLALIK